MSSEPSGHVAMVAFSDDDVATAYGVVVGVEDYGEAELPAAKLAYVREHRTWLERTLHTRGRELLEALIQESLTSAAAATAPLPLQHPQRLVLQDVHRRPHQASRGRRPAS